MMRYRLLLVTLAASGLAACGNGGAGSMVPQSSPALAAPASAQRSTTDVIGGSSGFTMMTMTARVSPSRATVTGNVTIGGAPDAGATVALKNSAGNVVATATTAADGSFSFAYVAYGTYEFSVAGVNVTSVPVGAATVSLGTVSL